MYKLASVLTGAVVTGGAVLALATPASAQGWPCYGCGDTTQVETSASEGSSLQMGLAALGGLTAAGLAGFALRRRTVDVV